MLTNSSPRSLAIDSAPVSTRCVAGLSCGVDMLDPLADGSARIAVRTCEVNIGTSQMEFLVTSGADRIFSSKDCQAKSEDLVKTIAPGASETANFPWARNRTLEGCSPVEAKPGAGGAYYIFTAKLGSRASPKAVFQLS